MSTNNKSPKILLENVNKQKANQTQKTTLQGDEQDKKYRFFKLLTSHSVDLFRQIDINQYDLSITEYFQQLQYIDEQVTPLIYCAHYGLKQICRYLLKNKNIDIDQETQNNKQTALIVACQNGNYQIVRYLILAGAQLNKPNSLNQNPLTIVLFRLVQQNYTFQNKKICFLIADILIKNGADVNWILDKAKGYSLLHYFCSSKMKMNQTQITINEQIIKFLLKNQANPNQRTLKDQTCFDLVKNHCNKQKILLLLNQYNQKYTQKNKIKMQENNKIRKMTDQFMKIQFKTKNNSSDDNQITKVNKLQGIKHNQKQTSLKIKNSQKLKQQIQFKTTNQQNNKIENKY